MTEELTVTPESRWLPTIDSWRATLARSSDLGDVRALRDRAEAVRHYAQVAGQSLEAQNIAAEAKLWAERRAGEILQDTPRQRPGEYQRSHDVTVAPTLDEIGVSKMQSSRWQAIADIPEEALVQFIEEKKTAREEITTAGLLANRNHRGLRSSESNEWYTPSRYIEAARLVLGGFDLDPASSEHANRTVQATKIYTVDDDGLAQPWEGRVWLNPPYGGLSADFTRRLVDEYVAGHVSAAVLLVNANSTDTAWFQPLFDLPLCFTNHRIDFESPTTKGSNSTHGSVFAYLGPDVAAFADEFSQFGAVVVRYAR